jgi:hypothetical protein
MTFVTMEGRVKFASMWAKHRQVMMELRAVQYEHVIRLDVPDENAKSLRDYLLEMRSQITGRNLFHSVDRLPAFMDKEGLSIVGMTYPDHLEEVKAVFSILPAYLRRIAGQSMDKWFTEEALVNANEAVFDDEWNTFVTADERMLDALLEEEVGGKGDSV